MKEYKITIEIKKEQDFVDWVEDLTWEEIYDITN